MEQGVIGQGTGVNFRRIRILEGRVEGTGGGGGGIRGVEKAVDSRLGFLRYASVRVAAFNFEKSSNLLSGFSEADTSPRLIT